MLAGSGFRIDGGRCIGPMWWIRVQAPDGVVVLVHGWTATLAGREAVDQLLRRGWQLDALSSDAITEGLRHQVYGR